MAFDDPGGFKRIEVVVGVLAIALVFREEIRVFGFADVVEESADAGEKRVGADGVGSVFGELRDDE